MSGSSLIVPLSLVCLPDCVSIAIRGSNRNLDKEAQKSFLQSNEKTHRGLADLLIAQGRLIKAQQILDMLTLDGTLRYLPLAALWDGKEYFGQKYENVVITLASRTRLGETDATGREIESFGEIAQQNGAKAVLATLWSVADESTQILMSEFYRIRTENPKITKSAAMRLAQKELLNGNTTRMKPSKSVPK